MSSRAVIRGRFPRPNPSKSQRVGILPAVRALLVLLLIGLALLPAAPGWAQDEPRPWVVADAQACVHANGRTFTVAFTNGGTIPGQLGYRHYNQPDRHELGLFAVGESKAAVVTLPVGQLATTLFKLAYTGASWVERGGTINLNAETDPWCEEVTWDDDMPVVHVDGDPSPPVYPEDEDVPDDAPPIDAGCTALFDRRVVLVRFLEDVALHWDARVDAATPYLMQQGQTAWALALDGDWVLILWVCTPGWVPSAAVALVEGGA